MTPAAYREALAELFATEQAPTGHAPFAEWLIEHGHTASFATLSRGSRRWAQVGPPGEIAVILTLWRKLRRPK